MELFYVLLVLLFVSRAFGALAHEAGQPSLVGELIAGIALGLVLHLWGPNVLGDLDLVEDETFGALTDLGIFFLMLMAGLELRPDEMRKASIGAVAIAVFGLLVPLGAGFGLAWWLLPASGAKVAQALFLGTALAITAVPVAARVLMDLGQLDSPVGRAIISAAVAAADARLACSPSPDPACWPPAPCPRSWGLGLLVFGPATATCFFLSTWLSRPVPVPGSDRAVPRIGVERGRVISLRPGDRLLLMRSWRRLAAPALQSSGTILPPGCSSAGGRWTEEDYNENQEGGAGG